MAVKDAKIRFLERELAEREQELQTMKEEEYMPVVETDDSRVRELEKKVNEVDALVKGLVNEVLDLKSIVMKLSRQTEERGKRIVETGERRTDMRRAEIQKPEPLQKKELVVEPRQAAPKAAVAQESPQEPRPGEKMDLIMQTDGTLKPERRSSSTYIVASANYNNRPMGGKKGGATSTRTKGRGDVDDLIQAEDDDTQEIKKK